MISSYTNRRMNETKVGKLHTKPTILTILFQNYSKVAKRWWLFTKVYDTKTSTECFVLQT